MRDDLMAKLRAAMVAYSGDGEEDREDVQRDRSPRLPVGQEAEKRSRASSRHGRDMGTGRRAGRTAPDMAAFVRGLVGQTIRTMNGSPNRVLAVGSDTALVGTTRSPDGREVDLREVQAAADRLYAYGELLIDKSIVGYRSAFVGAVLSLLPDTETEMRPRRIRLRHR